MPCPWQTSGPNEKAIAIAVGAFHSCALLESGNLKCWGAWFDLAWCSDWMGWIAVGVVGFIWVVVVFSFFS